jgi:hypothetical protein
MDEYLKTVKLYDQLCLERSHHSFWACNILDATRNLHDAVAWQNFYSYMANDQHEFTLNTPKTLGEMIDDGEIGDIYKNAIPMKEKIIMNGDVMLCYETPEIVTSINKTIDDEQKSLD